MKMEAAQDLLKSSFTAQVADLKTRLEEATSSVCKLTAELEATQSKLSSAFTAEYVETMHKQIQTLEGTLSVKQAVVGSMKEESLRQTQLYQDEVDSLTTKLQDSQNHCATLSLAKLELESYLFEQNKAVQGAATDEVERLQREVETRQSELDNLNAELGITQGDVYKAKGLLETAQSAGKDLQEKLSTLEETISSEHAVVESMREESLLQTQLYQEEVNSLTTKLQYTQNQCATLSLAKLELESKLSEQDKEVYAEASNEIERLHREVESLQSDLGMLRASLQTAQDDDSMARHLLETAESAEKALEEEFSILSDELTEAKETSSHQEQEIILLEEALVIAKKLCSDHLDSLDELKSTLSQQDSRVQGLEKCNADLRAKVDELQNDQETMSKELDRLNEVIHANV
jgi:chromosome segregation ATPase